MPPTRRERGQEEHGSGDCGLSMIELLIVIAIIGILAAIAIPAFFGEGDKARDAAAKEAAHTARDAMEVYATQNDGSFADATVSALNLIEPLLEQTSYSLRDLGTNQYAIDVTSSTGSTFSVTRSDSGLFSHTCSPPSTGGCPASGNW